MTTFRRILVLGVLTLAAGLAANRINPRGIPWRLLFLTWAPGPNPAERVPAEDAYLQMMDQEILFIDVREEQAFGIDHISGATHMPFLELLRHPASLDSLDRNRAYILYDFEAESRIPEMALNLMKTRGFRNASVLSEGFAGWLERGFPREFGEAP
jgi:rhodanese-related sulfurtransferase